MVGDDSVSGWIERIKRGDDEAAERIWHRYYGQLIELACRRLRGTPRRVADEEDIVATALE